MILFRKNQKFGIIEVSFNRNYAQELPDNYRYNLIIEELNKLGIDDAYDIDIVNITHKKDYAIVDYAIVRSK